MNISRDCYFRYFRCSVARVAGRLLESLFVSRPTGIHCIEQLSQILSPSLSVNAVTYVCSLAFVCLCQ